MVEIVESEGQTWQDQKGTLPNQGMILGTILTVSPQKKLISAAPSTADSEDSLVLGLTTATEHPEIVRSMAQTYKAAVRKHRSDRDCERRDRFGSSVVQVQSCRG